MIELRSVAVELDRVRILHEISFAAGDGEWISLIGPNGAGKTTLLRALAGLVPLAEGEIAIEGEPLAALSRRARAAAIAFVPQSPAAPPEIRVDEYVLLGRTPHIGHFSAETRADRDAAGRALVRLDLEPFAERRLGTLSGGERQRAVLARAIAQDARILLLDEPTGALDVGRQQQALELVDRLRGELGLTVLSATHDLTLAGQYGDRLLLLDEGRIVADGPPGDVLRDELIEQHYGASVRVFHEDGGFVVAPRRRPRVPASPS